MKNDTRPIGVFDSGLGGLSVLKELKRALPRENFIFLADQGNVPYGEKSSAQLQDIGLKTAKFLEKKGVKLIVIACNTSTCYSIEFIRKRIKTLLVGTVPAVKKASKSSVNNSIAILSTPATSRSPYLKRLILDHTSDMSVMNIGCYGLEDAVEKGNINSSRVKKLLETYLHLIKVSGPKSPDCIVLGCTHYPFIAKIIKEIVGKKINIIDSGEAIAKRVSYLVSKNKIVNHSGGEVEYFTTGNPRKFSKAASLLMCTPIHSSFVVI
jgi:glutamate racemase